MTEIVTLADAPLATVCDDGVTARTNELDPPPPPPPPPLPDGTSNVAVTVRSPSIVTAHVPVPLQPPPDQPVNVDPAAAVAVRTTAVGSANVPEHVAPQAMLPGVLVTLPLPLPS